MNYDSYFGQLLESECEAVEVPFRAVSHDDFEPRKNDCHNNVDYWVIHHREATAVRGWIFWGPGTDGRYNIMAHSVLDEAGILVDITPIDENTPRVGLRFLRHTGSEEEFNTMKGPFSQLFYPFFSFDEWRNSQLSMPEEEMDF